MAATIPASPATLQPCKKNVSGSMLIRSPPRPWRRRLPQHVVIADASSSSRGPKAATGGRLETSTDAAAVAGEDGDVIRRLQNGPDVRGVALEGENGRAVDLTPLAVEVIAESFGEWLREELQQLESGRDGGEVRVSVGRDPRLSGARLGAALFAGLARAGCSVFDVGLATTPACFMSTKLPRFSYDASIMVKHKLVFFFFACYFTGNRGSSRTGLDLNILFSWNRIGNFPLLSIVGSKIRSAPHGVNGRNTRNF